MDEIKKELAPHALGISKKYLRDYFQDQKRSLQQKLAYIEVINGEIKCDCLDTEKLSKERIYRFLALIRTLILSKKIPKSFEMIFSLHDSLSINEPILTVAKKMGSQTILTPDFFVFQGYQDFPPLITEGNRLYPWEKKKNIGYWRGGTTGAIYSYPSCLSLPRVALVNLSLQFPSLLDCAFTNYVQFNSEIEERLFAEKYPLKPFVPVPFQMEYKYLIDVDGNTCNDSRFYWMLHANSVLLKQTSSDIFWFSHKFKPFEHYIPFNSDLSDLMEKLDWACNHDLECRNIALMASSLANKVYKIENQRSYLSELICEYTDLLY